jgi:heat shock protein HslJ
MKQLIILSSAALLLFSSCGNSKNMSATPTGKNATGETTVTDVSWSLTELNGKPIVQAPDDKMIYVKFNSKENKLEGNGGCNSLFGNYEISNDQKIKLTVGSTMMACAKMDIESSFTKALTQADKYFINKDTLQLWKDNVALAKFEAKFFTK